jgi:pseudouridine-5'-phosphate glycosidase
VSFFTRSSGLPLDVQVNTPGEAARIINAALKLNLGHGVLITVPVPAEFAMDDTLAESAIEQATYEANDQGIHGKEVTPFLLARVAELTGGESRKANKALLINNATVAAQIAASVSESVKGLTPSMSR